MSFRKIIASLAFLVFVGFASPASAGPLVEAAAEVEEVVDKVADKVEEFVTTTIRKVQGYLVAANDAVRGGDQKSARSLALGAQFELRKIAVKVGVTLRPLTEQELKDKATTDHPMFKSALRAMPPGAELVQAVCKAPTYAISCCPAGQKLVNGRCKGK